MDRRQVLGSMVALAAPLPAWASEAIGPSLDELARRKGLRFGAAITDGPEGSARDCLDDPQYRAVMAHECGVL